MGLIDQSGLIERLDLIEHLIQLLGVSSVVHTMWYLGVLRREVRDRDEWRWDVLAHDPPLKGRDQKNRSFGVYAGVCL